MAMLRKYEDNYQLWVNPSEQVCDISLFSSYFGHAHPLPAARARAGVREGDIPAYIIIKLSKMTYVSTVFVCELGSSQDSTGEKKIYVGRQGYH